MQISCLAVARGSLFSERDSNFRYLILSDKLAVLFQPAKLQSAKKNNLPTRTYNLKQK